MPSQLFEFGPYRLSGAQKLLLNRGSLVPLTPKAVEVLLVLLQRAGQVVSKQEIINQVWPDTAVVDGNLTQTIFMLRKALGERKDGTSYIETVPKLGYRFVETVGTSELAASPAADSRVAGLGSLPAVRPQSVLLVVALALFLGVPSWYVWRQFESHRSHEVAAHRIQSIAVLPMTNLSGNASQYFADGMTDELITTLAELPALQVTSRTSSTRYRNSSKSLPQIARELGVDAIVEGAVRRSGDHVRISAQLIEGAADRHIWAAEYDFQLSDSLVIQADMAREIARQIQLRLDPAAEAHLRLRRPLDPEAQDEYLLGRFYWNRRAPADLRQAILHFRKAVAIDPRYAEAFAGLADCYLVLPIYGRSTGDTVVRAKAAAQEALRLDSSLAEAHTSLAYALEYEWDFSGAEREYRRAIALKPSYAVAHQWYGEFLRFMGRQQEAVAQSDIATRLDPLSPVIRMESAFPYYYRGQYAEALRRLRQAIALDANFGPAYGNLGWVLESQGDYPGALRAFEQAKKCGLGDSPWILAGIGWAYARSGDTVHARRYLAQLKSLVSRSRGPNTQIALLLLALDNKPAALRWFHRAFQQHDWWLLSVGVDPKLAPLRGSRQFRELAGKVGLPS